MGGHQLSETRAALPVASYPSSGQSLGWQELSASCLLPGPQHLTWGLTRTLTASENEPLLQGAGDQSPETRSEQPLLSTCQLQ